MSDETPKAAKATYQWSRGRIALGVAIVLVAGTFIGFVVRREFAAFQLAAEGDELYGRLIEAVTSEQAGLFDLANLTVARSQIAFGGPPKDGIAAISNPEIVAFGEIEKLRDDDRMIGVVVEGEARAYPIRVLTYHEAVNDTIGDTPIAVVYCPLCDSVSVVDRRLEGTVREFGISGLLVNSNVLLYDRTDDSLWSLATLRSSARRTRSVPCSSSLRCAFSRSATRS